MCLTYIMYVIYTVYTTWYILYIKKNNYQLLTSPRLLKLEKILTVITLEVFNYPS